MYVSVTIFVKSWIPKYAGQLESLSINNRNYPKKLGV